MNTITKTQLLEIAATSRRQSLTINGHEIVAYLNGDRVMGSCNSCSVRMAHLPTKPETMVKKVNAHAV